MAPRIRIAIIGGSIAGCALANGLLEHAEHIAFDLFEGKPEFAERGAGVGIAPNGQKALAAMGMDAEALLGEAGAVKMGSSYCLIGQGEHKGKHILTLPGGVFIVDRKRWLEALLAPLPKERLHAGKKLQSVDQTEAGGPYRLHFEDGSMHEADAIIGCDGSRSMVRRHVLGSVHADAWSPRFGGYWDARGRSTPEKAAEHFGRDLFDPTAANEVALVGKGAFLLFAPSDEGKVYHVIISAKAGAGYDSSAWKTQLSREFLEASCKDWEPRFRDGMIESLMADDSGPGVVFSQWESAPTPRYHRDGLCVMGDAAHTAVPWMGQGASLSLEDAAVMSALLGSLRKPEDVAGAFAAFDSVRRNRAEHVIRQSQEAAKVLTGQVSMDPAEVEHLQAEKWWTDIWTIDMEKHVQSAVDKCSG